MAFNETPRKLWEHPDPESTPMYKFMQEANKKHNLPMRTFHDLYEFSITQRSKFWALALDFLNVIYSGSYTRVVDESAPIEAVPHWFDGININIAENLLYSRQRTDPVDFHGTKGKEDAKVAVTEIREGGTEIRDVTWAQLRQEVAQLASAMKASNVKKGDRIAVVASNSYDTLKVFLATTTLGGQFSSSSTDMGTKGVLDRLLQIEPKFIFMDDWAVYNGKTVDLRSKMREILSGMSHARNFTSLISMPRFSTPEDISLLPKTQTLAAFLFTATASPTLSFEHTAFRDPFLIAYSSGTTGVPKCIVHSCGGALISMAKEITLHKYMSPDDVCMQYTTTGWIMYLMNVVALLPGTRIVLYDGSPFIPNAKVLLQIAADQKVTRFGVSPRWMMQLQKENIVPQHEVDLSRLKMVMSTGMVLTDKQFDWFYDVAFPKEVHLANMSGGTDIAGCFGCGNPLTPVYTGGTQGPSLGTPLAILTSSSPHTLLPPGTPGELCAPAAFPNMPTHFHGDLPPSSHKSKYFSAYFAAIPHMWTHGDFITYHPITGHILFLGRSDGVLNPSGIRFGSAELYSVIDGGFRGEVSDALAVGQRRRGVDDDERVILFLLMRPGKVFSEELVDRVKARVRSELSARHVPLYVFETKEIPTTVNGKKVELPVKQIVSGQIVVPSGTLLNPESLEYYYRFAKVEELVGEQVKAKL